MKAARTRVLVCLVRHITMTNPLLPLSDIERGVFGSVANASLLFWLWVLSMCSSNELLCSWFCVISLDKTVCFLECGLRPLMADDTRHH